EPWSGPRLGCALHHRGDAVDRPHGASSYLTTSTPAMPWWTLQWNAYRPGVIGALKCAIPPLCGTPTAKLVPSSEVTVWNTSSKLTTFTLAPGTTFLGVVYAYAWMMIRLTLLTVATEWGSAWACAPTAPPARPTANTVAHRARATRLF